MNFIYRIIGYWTSLFTQEWIRVQIFDIFDWHFITFPIAILNENPRCSSYLSYPRIDGKLIPRVVTGYKFKTIRIFGFKLVSYELTDNCLPHK